MIEPREVLIVTVLVVGAAMMVGDGAARRAVDRDGAPAFVQLAQFGDMTKQQGTPVPRRTPDGADGRDQRGENAERPGSPFGAIHK